MAAFATGSFVELANMLPLPTRSNSWGAQEPLDTQFFPKHPEVKRLTGFGPVGPMVPLQLLNLDEGAYMPPPLLVPFTPVLPQKQSAPSELSEAPPLETPHPPSPVQEPKQVEAEPKKASAVSLTELAAWQCPSDLRAEKKRLAQERKRFRLREQKRKEAYHLLLAREAHARANGVSEAAIAAQRRANMKGSKPWHSCA